MIKISNGKINKNKRKKILKFSKGFNNSKLYKQIHQRYVKSLHNIFISRKLKKRYFRKFWILKINNFLKSIGVKYSLFISSLKKQKIALDRKILLNLLIFDKLHTI